MSEILIIIILILLNGVLSMSEIALISVRKSQLSNQIKKGNGAAKTALKLADEPERFLSTVQIGITVIGILTGIYSGSVLADDFSAVIMSWGIPANYAHPVAQTVIVVVVTYFTLILGELVPKRLGMTAAEKVAIAVAKPMRFLSIAVSPFVWLLSGSTHLIMRIFKLDESADSVTEEEIKSMIEEGAKGGQVQPAEQNIMERAFMLGDLKVSSLMTRRSDIVSLSLCCTKEDIRAIISKNIFEMYPIVNGNIDSIVGVVRLKDLVGALCDGQDAFSIEDIMTAPLYFHESMSVYKVLEQMRRQRVSQALICDEFGTVQGIITLKDILEGLVGEIQEAHEEPDIIARHDGNSWYVDGQCPMYDFLVHFNRAELFSSTSDYVTISGLLLRELEHIPVSGERVVWNDFVIEIADMDGARIDKIVVWIETTP